MLDQLVSKRLSQHIFLRRGNWVRGVCLLTTELLMAHACELTERRVM